MEYVMYGRLLTFLREHRTQQTYYNYSTDSEALTSRDLTTFAYCIAKGMDFITSQRVRLTDHDTAAAAAVFLFDTQNSSTTLSFLSRPAGGAPRFGRSQRPSRPQQVMQSGRLWPVTQRAGHGRRDVRAKGQGRQVHYSFFFFLLLLRRELQ